MKPLMNEEFKEKLQNNMIQVMEKAKDLFYVEQYTHTYTFQGGKGTNQMEGSPANACTST